MTSTASRLDDLARLRRVRDRIDREYASPLDVEALARDAHMSPGHFSREFRRAFGESPYSHLMTRRIERAMALLRRGDLTVTEVSLAVGCASLGTFSTRFTELVGMPPSAYRRRAAQATEGCRPAWPSRSRDRSGIEKRARRAGSNVPAMDITIHSSFVPQDDPDARVRADPGDRRRDRAGAHRPALRRARLRAARPRRHHDPHPGAGLTSCRSALTGGHRAAGAPG